MRKRNKKILIGVLVILAVAVLAYFLLIKKPEIQSVVNEGVAIKALIVDENGNVKMDLSQQVQPTLAIISAPTPSGYLSISPYTCTVGCSFLALQTTLDNTGGDSGVTVSDMIGTNPCSSGNTNPGCTGIANVLGSPTTAGNRRGNLNALWDLQLPSIILLGQLGPSVLSNGMALDEIAFGLIDFTVTASGTFLDPFGNPQPLIGKYGTLPLRIASSTCSDGTDVDPDSSDADIAGYCSTINKGKYCRVGAEGMPTLTDRASLCGCPTGYYAQGEVCKITSCTPNQCIAGTINYCLADGQSIESRCNTCGSSNCPLDVNGKSAIDCEPSTGEPSQCKYPISTAGGFLVQFSPVSIPSIPQCGDGIKSGSEQCDKKDFGGQSCTSVGTFSGGTLTCNADCTYNTAGCTTTWVKFRTLFSAINSANDDGIAWSTACNGIALTKAGDYDTTGGVSPGSGTTCDLYMPSIGYSKILDITSGVTSVVRGSFTATQSFSLWNKVNDYVVCGISSTGKVVYTGYRTTQSTIISDSANIIDSSKETLC